MTFEYAVSAEKPFFDAINEKYRCNEQAHLQSLLQQLELTNETRKTILTTARQLATQTRQRQQQHQGSDAFLQEYDLTSEEGVLLMCLAEALLRIPDAATQEALIANKLAQGHWDTHLGQSHSFLVNASTWGLLLTGQMVNLAHTSTTSPRQRVQKLAGRLGEKVIRVAIKQAMSLLAQQFVMGAHIEQALKRSKQAPTHLRFSFDCLGEAACCQGDVDDYFNAYQHAIKALAAQVEQNEDIMSRPSISVKLSALHPRYEVAQYQRVMQELVPRLHQLVMDAKQAGIGLTIDAEEASRLSLSLEIFAIIYRDDMLKGWDGFGLAIQAYQKRALAALHYLSELYNTVQRRIPIRLVKGAYWDSEIKWAQERGLDGYPIFTRKVATDVSYLCCTQYLFKHPEQFYPQFATHNAYTICFILTLAGDHQDFELQRLHGMGEVLYELLHEQHGKTIPCRIYAPIGSHETLLPYLVRRLLENGANSSFVNQLADEDTCIEEIITDPMSDLESLDCTPHPKIPLPADLYRPERINAYGFDLNDEMQLQTLTEQIQSALETSITATPLIKDQAVTGVARQLTDPADQQHHIGAVIETEVDMVEQAFNIASDAFSQWSLTPAQERSDLLERCAKLFEHHMGELMALIIREGGRTMPDAQAELREAIDACRYYAQQGRHLFNTPITLPGPTGEQNTLSLHGRGVFACISPWNFPVAIFTAQIAAALMAGNSVIAKPASATPLSAFRVIQLMHKAGIPKTVLHFLPGRAGLLSKPLLTHTALAGVAFTGSTETAWAIHQQLAARQGPIMPLIAETGGMNAMIIDSSALPEQVVKDVLTSAFNSAGQRCSALRLLFVQQDIADHLISLLAAAMDELSIGDPMHLATDIGPLIDAEAKEKVQQHVEHMKTTGRLIKSFALPTKLPHGHFLAPHLFEIEDISVLEKEVFGPVLHVVRFEANRLDQVIDSINATGYGLTLGVHSRIESTWQRVQQRARVGNLYINRNIIGAVMGVQPFGGEGLSGTGFKAGGPHYLLRFATERTTTINTAAIGGNTNLLVMQAEDDSK